MVKGRSTLGQSRDGRTPGARKAPVPGVVLIFSAAAPVFCPIPLGEGGSLELGRIDLGPIAIDDPCVSRRHAQVSYDGNRWTIRDLDSRNGTAIDGRPLEGEWAGEDPRLLRVGDTLLLPRADIRSYLGGKVAVIDDRVSGPLLTSTFAQVTSAGKMGAALHLTGESGSGKE